MIAEINTCGRRFRQRRYPDFNQKSKYIYIAQIPDYEEQKWKKRAMRDGYKFRAFDEKFARSGAYRYKFIQANPPQNGYYRCRYCHKKLKKDDMVVDHVIPVAEAKRSAKAQRMLHGKSVNDLSNLVPCCTKCNQKKGSHFSRVWVRRARIRKYDLYWAIRHLCVLLLTMAAVSIIYVVFKQKNIRTAQDLLTALREINLLWFFEKIINIIKFYASKLK